MARVAAACLLTLAACAERPDPEGAAIRVLPLASPAGVGSAEPFLAEGPDGRALLTWLEPSDSGHALRMAMLEDTVWSAPRTVAAGRDFIVNWADFPGAVSLGGDRLAVHWLEREGADTYAYGVRMSFSDDGGRSWTPPIRPHRDSTETEHGFVSMLAAGDGVDAVWLDGRNFAEDRREMTLRAARVDAASTSEEAVLDPRVCDCCQTDAAATANGAVVVYRDRSADEIRDIAIVRRVEGRWTEPVIVHADGWRIEGCPVNGPAVAASGELVAVAWFTAAHDSARVLVAFSSDGGATFVPPVRVDGGDPVGRVDLALDDGDAVVSWIEQGGGSGAIQVRRVASNGGMGPATTVERIPPSRGSGFPRMAPAAGSLVIAWTDPDAGVVRTARIAVR